MYLSELNRWSGLFIDLLNIDYNELIYKLVFINLLNTDTYQNTIHTQHTRMHTQVTVPIHDII